MKKQSPREKLLHEIKTLHDLMREEVIEAGIQPAQYDAPLRDFAKKTNEELEAFYFFLQLFNTGPYTKLLKVRNLRPREFWDNLKLLFQQHSLIEQRLLRAEQKKVRDAWFKKYAQEESA